MRTRLVGGFLVWIALALAPRTAQAQAPEYGGGIARYLSGGGEITAVAGREDDVAFFNYSDYERNLLRIARLRLFGEWRPAERLSVIGELRTENADDVTAPALYVRWRPSLERDFFVHAGRIPPIIGGFSRHAYGRDNIVVGQPLAYQYLTLLRPDALPATIDDLARMRGRGWQTNFPIGAQTLAPGVPLLSVSKWDTGVSGLWRHGIVDISGAVTRGAPALPVVRETNGGLMGSSRIAARLGHGLTLGVSAARGQWLTDDVLALEPGGTDRPSAQTVIGTDMEFGAGPWLLRGEWVRSTFELPLAWEPNPDARLTAWSSFIEARYRPFPRWQIGARLERLAFGSVPGTSPNAGLTSWDANVERVEAIVGFRATRHIELRGGWQHNWRDGGRVRERGLPIFAVLCWF
jgi:hypothetical protein